MIPGPWQIILIVIVVLLLFGAGRLPRIANDIAQGIKSFKKGLKDEGEDDKDPSAPPKDLDEQKTIGGPENAAGDLDQNTRDEAEKKTGSGKSS